jgi:hypothetical protein
MAQVRELCGSGCGGIGAGLGFPWICRMWVGLGVGVSVVHTYLGGGGGGVVDVPDVLWAGAFHRPRLEEG